MNIEERTHIAAVIQQWAQDNLDEQLRNLLDAEGKLIYAFCAYGAPGLNRHERRSLEKRLRLRKGAIHGTRPGQNIR